MECKHARMRPNERHQMILPFSVGGLEDGMMYFVTHFHFMHLYGLPVYETYEGVVQYHHPQPVKSLSKAVTPTFHAIKNNLMLLGNVYLRTHAHSYMNTHRYAYNTESTPTHTQAHIQH